MCEPDQIAGFGPFGDGAMIVETHAAFEALDHAVVAHHHIGRLSYHRCDGQERRRRVRNDVHTSHFALGDPRTPTRVLGPAAGAVNEGRSAHDPLLTKGGRAMVVSVPFLWRRLRARSRNLSA